MSKITGQCLPGEGTWQTLLSPTLGLLDGLPPGHPAYLDKVDKEVKFTSAGNNKVGVSTRSAKWEALKPTDYSTNNFPQSSDWFHSSF